jgi:putative nucleotidyltransferase with HDIG domain
MKDAGCSSNAARVSQLFGGNDQDAKRGRGAALGRDCRRRAVERAITANEPRLDRIAHAFALVVDAKSTFTYQHSDRVAAISDAIAAEMGLPAAARVRLRRAALLHDIGKLSVPNRILDKPGKLDADEWDVLRRHPHFTYEILARVPVFSEFAYDASCHHERIDGRGYHRGGPGEALSQTAHISRRPTSSMPSRPRAPTTVRCRSSRCSRSSARDAARSCVR